MSKPKAKKEKLRPFIESPTWGALHRMAKAVMTQLGGPKGAAGVLSQESYYTLSLFAALDLTDAQAATPVLGKKRIY